MIFAAGGLCIVDPAAPKDIWTALAVIAGILVITAAILITPLWLMHRRYLRPPPFDDPRPERDAGDTTP